MTCQSPAPIRHKQKDTWLATKPNTRSQGMQKHKESKIHERPSLVWATQRKVNIIAVVAKLQDITKKKLTPRAAYTKTYG